MTAAVLRLGGSAKSGGGDLGGACRGGAAGAGGPQWLGSLLPVSSVEMVSGQISQLSPSSSQFFYPLKNENAMTPLTRG